MSRHPLRRLLICGLLSVAIYVLAFAMPYGVSRLANEGSPADLGVISGYSVAAGLGYIAALLALFALYLLAVRAAAGLSGWRVVLVIVGTGVVSAVVLCFVYPFGAADVFLYIVRGRMLGLHGLNPMSVPASVLPANEYLPFPSEWANVPSNYGPLWEWTAAGLARLGDGSLLRELVVFKAFGLLCYLACVLVLGAILQEHDRASMAQGLVLLSWNPLVLLEVHASVHNDLYMVLFILLALWFWGQRRYPGVIFSLALGGLVKYIPFLLLPPTLVLMARDLPWRVFLKNTLVGMAVSIPIALGLFLPLWPGWGAWDLTRQVARMYASASAWLILLLQMLLRPDLAFSVGAWALRSVFVIAFLLILWRMHAGRLPLADAYHHVLYALLVFVVSAFGYWYILWLAALVPLVDSWGARLRTILFGLCGLISVVLYGFVNSWTEGRIDALQAHFLVVPFVFGLPFLAADWLERRYVWGQAVTL